MSLCEYQGYTVLTHEPDCYNDYKQNTEEQTKMTTETQ